MVKFMISIGKPLLKGEGPLLHELKDKQYNCVYVPGRKPSPDDRLLIYDGENVLLKNGDIPFVKDLVSEDPRFLFSVDETAFFLAKTDAPPADAAFVNVHTMRSFPEQWLAFAAVTGFHLYNWYRKTVFCGACGHRLRHKEDERAMICPACGGIFYPYIASAVIVGVTDKDRIVLTKYAGRAHTDYALVAGFTEPGEAPEDTVRREVFEETGLKVGRIRYYGSQPWGYSSSVLLGFFAELEGEDTVTVQEEELSEAGWFRRDEVPERDCRVSLTSEMMNAFRLGTEQKGDGKWK